MVVQKSDDSSLKLGDSSREGKNKADSGDI